MTPTTINKIGSTIATVAKLALMGGAVYAAWFGHWLAAILIVWVAIAVHWKKDGQWASEETEN